MKHIKGDIKFEELWDDTNDLRLEKNLPLFVVVIVPRIIHV
jgi:hypothetical protein